MIHVGVELCTVQAHRRDDPSPQRKDTHTHTHTHTHSHTHTPTHTHTDNMWSVHKSVRAFFLIVKGSTPGKRTLCEGTSVGR